MKELEKGFTKEITIFFGKDTITLQSSFDILLLKAWHYGPDHKLAPVGKNSEMTVSVGATPDHVRFACPWCRFCFEFQWNPGTPFKKVTEQIRKTISSQSHD